MAEDRSYIDANMRQRDRLRAFIERVDDQAFAAPANEFWTVAGVFGHMAYWDSRVLVLAEKIDRGEPWVPADEEPDGDWLNDSTRPIIHAIEPRRAAQLALEIATGDRRGGTVPELGRAYYERGPGRTSDMLSTRFGHLADRGLLHVDDPSLASQEFVWLVLSIPLNRAMLSGDERLSDEELQRYADEAARVFFAAYRPAPSARKSPSRKSTTAGSGKKIVR